MIRNSFGLPLVLAAAGGVFSAILFAVLLEGVLYQYLRKAYATALVIFIASLGILIFVENTVAMFFGTDAKSLSGFPIITMKVGGLGFSTLHITMLIAAIVMIGGLMVYLAKTEQGKAMRAVISNPEMAEVIGINIKRVFLWVHVLAAILVGVAAVLVTLERGATPDLGHWAILYSFIPVIIGGVGSMPGAALAGYIVGFAESIGIWKIASQWQLGIAFIILLVVLVLKPNGLLGYSVYRGKI
jgi:branched-subunit amino acid ABC-type transport system permease component